MKEFKFIEKVTDNILLSFVIWIALAFMANMLSKVGLDDSILGEAIVAAMEVVGLFLFIKSVWKWYKRSKSGKGQI